MIAHYHKTYTWTYFIPLMKMDMWIIPFIKINQCWYDNTYANSVTFLLAISIAYVAWIVTHEEVFKEPWEYCSKRSTTAKTLLVRKFFLTQQRFRADSWSIPNHCKALTWYAYSLRRVAKVG